MVEAKKMNTTLRTSLVALLSLIPILVMTGCSEPTPGVANPAGTTSSSTSEAAPTVPNAVPNSVPNSVTTIQPPAESPTSVPDSTEPSSDKPGSQQPGPTGPAVLPTDLSGEVYGYVRAVDVQQSQLTLDKIDWFTGAAARQACIEDGVPLDMGDNWCTGYYFRNVNPALRVVTVSPAAVVTTLDGNIPVTGDLTALANRITTPTGSSRPYRLVVTDGAITDVTEMYQP